MSRWAVVAVLASGCSTPASTAEVPAAQPPAPVVAEKAAAEEVRPELTGRVEAKLTGEHVIDGKRTAWSVEGSWSIAIERTEEKQLYRVSDFSGWRGEVPGRFVDGPGFLLPYLSPIELTRDGAFSRLVDPEGTAKVFREQLPVMTQAGDRVVVDTALSSAGLNAVAGDHWQGEREIWRQLALEPGQEQKLLTRVPVPQLGGGVLDIVLEARRGDDVACPRAPARRCATFTARTFPDRAQTEEIMAKMAARPKAFEMESTLTLVAELGTLVPYDYTFERSTAFDVPGQGGKTAAKNRRAYAYTYE